MFDIKKLIPKVRKTNFFDELHEVAQNSNQISSLFGNLLKAHENPDFSANYYIVNKIQSHHYDDTISILAYMLENKVYPSDYAFLLQVALIVSSVFSEPEQQEQIGAYLGLILKDMIDEGYNINMSLVTSVFEGYRDSKENKQLEVSMYHLEATIHMALVADIFDTFDAGDAPTIQKNIQNIEAYLSAVLHNENINDKEVAKFYEVFSEMYFYCQIIQQLGYDVNDLMGVLAIHRVNTHSMFDKAIEFIDTGKELPFPTNEKEQKHWCQINLMYEKMDIFLAQKRGDFSL